MTARTAQAAQRRRRRPEEAEREILDAARELFRTLPSHEVTVSRIMSATTLSRKSFYVYFRDRHELLVRMFARLRADADAVFSRLADDERDPVAIGRGAVEAAARLYSAHGEILAALADAAPRDPEAAEAWRSFVAPVRRMLIELVEREQAAGRIEGIAAEPTVTALMAMNVARFRDVVATNPDADLDPLVDDLYRIWIRTLYGRLPPDVERALEAS